MKDLQISDEGFKRSAIPDGKYTMSSPFHPIDFTIEKEGNTITYLDNSKDDIRDKTYDEWTFTPKTK